MRYYISTIADDASEVAKEYSLGLEIAEFCTAMNMDELFEEMSGKVAAKIEGIGNLIFHGPFNELFPCAIDPKARELAAERFRQSIRLATDYGIRKVVLHGGFNPYLFFPVWYKEESLKFWKDFMGTIPEDMTLCVENVLEPEPEMLMKIADGVASERFKLCLDIGHVNAYSKVPVMEWLEAYGDRIGHFHIHNNFGEYDSHSSIDDGKMDIAALLRRAEEICPDASCTLEVLSSRRSAEVLKSLGII